MKVLRLIIGGIPYKLVQVKLDVDDSCVLCSLYELCHRYGVDDSLDPRYLCDLNGDITDDTFFTVDTDVDKTIKEVLKDEY